MKGFSQLLAEELHRTFMAGVRASAVANGQALDVEVLKKLEEQGWRYVNTLLFFENE